MESLRLAVGLFTVVPVGPTSPPDRRRARNALLLAPLAVLPVAVVAALAGWALQLVLPAPLGGVAVVAVLALGTRALHLDGLADTVDGLGSGWDRERALTVMRSGDVGPMGVVALVLVLLTQVVAASTLLRSPAQLLALVALIMVSRWAVLPACTEQVPAARPDGLGALVAGSVPAPVAIFAWVGGLVLATTLAVPGSWWSLVPAVLVALATSLLQWHAVRRFGGITGDVLGALVEVALTVALVAAVAVTP